MIDKVLVGYGSYGFCIKPPFRKSDLIIVNFKKYNNISPEDISKLFKYNSLYGDHENDANSWITYDDDSDTQEGFLRRLKMLKNLDICLSKKDIKILIKNCIKNDHVVNSVIEFMNELLSYNIIKKIDPKNIFTPKIKGINIIKFNDNNKDVLIDLYNREDKFKDSSEYDINLQDIYPQIIMENSGVIVKNMNLNLIQCINKLIIFVEGLKKINDNGYIHRDVKNSNVLYNYYKFTLIDYGLMINKNELYSNTQNHRLSYKYKYNPPEHKIIHLFNTNFKKYSSLLLSLIDDPTLINDENKKNKILFNDLYNAYVTNLSYIYVFEKDANDKFKIDSDNKLNQIIYNNMSLFLLDIAKKYKSNQELYNNSQTLFEDCIHTTDVYSLGLVFNTILNNGIFEKNSRELFEYMTDTMHTSNPYNRPSFDIILKLLKCIKTYPDLDITNFKTYYSLFNVFDKRPNFINMQYGDYINNKEIINIYNKICNDIDC